MTDAGPKGDRVGQRWGLGPIWPSPVRGLPGPGGLWEGGAARPGGGEEPGCQRCRGLRPCSRACLSARVFSSKCCFSPVFCSAVVGMVPCPSEARVDGTAKVSPSPVCLLQVAGVFLSVWLRLAPSAGALVADVCGSLPVGIGAGPCVLLGCGLGSRSGARGPSAPAHGSCIAARPPPRPHPAPELQLDGVGEGHLTALGRGQWRGGHSGVVSS